MPLYEFELARVEDIQPWGEPGSQSLSWFALTLGSFRMPVGDQILFRYTDEIQAHWGERCPDADYQIAAFVRELLGSYAPAMATLPPLFERLAARPDLLTIHANRSVDALGNRHYSAWRWLGERSPGTSYLVACPNFSYVRIDDQVRVCWDNTECAIDGIPVWTAKRGTYAMPIAVFVSESRRLSELLLDAMAARIGQIERGEVAPRIPLDGASLHRQQQEWRDELDSYLRAEYTPDVPWDEAEAAIRAEAEELGVPLDV